MENIKKVRLHQLRSQERLQRSMQARDGIHSNYLADALKKVACNPRTSTEDETGGGGDDATRLPNNQRKKLFMKQKWKKIKERTSRSTHKRSISGEVKQQPKRVKPAMEQLSLKHGIVKVIFPYNVVW